MGEARDSFCWSGLRLSETQSVSFQVSSQSEVDGEFDETVFSSAACQGDVGNSGGRDIHPEGREADLLETPLSRGASRRRKENRER